MKVYTAESGYIYHYYYLGRQEEEYRFEISADRRTWSVHTVELDAAGTRRFTANERYGLAKLSLFAAFDGAESPQGLGVRIRPRAEQIADYIYRLGL